MFEQPQLANLPISAASLSSAQDKARSGMATQPGWGGQGERWSRCCWGWCGVSSGRGMWQEPPAIPAQPREARQGVWRGSKRATEASLGGALWASRGSALISWAWRFLAALMPAYPPCPTRLTRSPSEPLPISCIPHPKASPCTRSQPSTWIQHAFSLWRAARCRLSHGKPLPLLCSPENPVAVLLHLHSAGTWKPGSFNLGKKRDSPWWSPAGVLRGPAKARAT